MATFIGLAPAVAALVVGAASQHTSDAYSVHAAVHVRVYEQANVDADTLTRAMAEATRIYREAGIRIQWLDTEAVSRRGQFAIHMIIRRTPTGVTADPTAMGTTLGNEHARGGTAFVFYDRVLRTAHGREQDVAGVLGYAIAHEMGHVLLPYPAHSETGIMRAGWDGDDLRRIAIGSLKFTPTQASLLRQRLGLDVDTVPPRSSIATHSSE